MLASRNSKKSLVGDFLALQGLGKSAKSYFLVTFWHYRGLENLKTSLVGDCVALQGVRKSDKVTFRRLFGIARAPKIRKNHMSLNNNTRLKVLLLARPKELWGHHAIWENRHEVSH